ncbi:MAG: isoprenyl transferase [Bacteroidia bacterium]|nr:isoprenyl transferase [Bacteroidia bacterium]
MNEILKPVPVHVAIIMDGNGRWAKSRGKNRIEGHREGVNSVKEVVKAAVEIGIRYLTLYTFSTENWNRPKEEVDALMELLVGTISSQTHELIENGVKLTTIGDMESLPRHCREELEECISLTSNGKNIHVILALSYSSKWEITQAVRKIAEKVKAGILLPEKINEFVIEEHLATSGLPDPDLLIRTGGECRISNYLLWQLAYAEFYFTPVMWPDFRKKEFLEAIEVYQKRERRYGMTSEQIVSGS